MNDLSRRLANLNRAQAEQIDSILAIYPFNQEDAPDTMGPYDMAQLFNAIGGVLGETGFIDASGDLAPRG